MRIAIITPTLHYGGGERQVEFLSLGLKQKGHLVSVYCLADRGIIADILEANGIKVVCLFSPFVKNILLSKNKEVPWNENGLFRKSGKVIKRFLKAINEILAGFKLLVIFLRNKPEIVHLYQNQTKMAIVVSKICGIPKVIYTETSLIGDWFTPVQLFFMRIILRFADEIVVLSSAMRDNMLKLKLASESKLHLIYAMFPFSSVKRIEGTENNSSHIRVGIIGRLSAEKGHIYFLRAASLISKKFENVKFIIAGDGYLRKDLEKFCEDLKIEDRVSFLGTFSDVEDVMSQIDIFVLSSLTEGMPLVLIESMAYCKPIVATDVGGVREFIRNGETGLLVSPKNPFALAEAIIRLINNPRERVIFCRQATREFKDTYSTERNVPYFESLYSKSSGCGNE